MEWLLADGMKGSQAICGREDYGPGRVRDVGLEHGWRLVVRVTVGNRLRLLAGHGLVVEVGQQSCR